MANLSNLDLTRDRVITRHIRQSQTSVNELPKGKQQVSDFFSAEMMRNRIYNPTKKSFDYSHTKWQSNMYQADKGLRCARCGNLNIPFSSDNSEFELCRNCEFKDYRDDFERIKLNDMKANMSHAVISFSSNPSDIVVRWNNEKQTTEQILRDMRFVLT